MPDYSDADLYRFADGGSCAKGLPGAEVVYAFIPSASAAYTVSVLPELGFDPAVVVLEGSCAPNACVAAADDGGAGEAERVSFSAQANTTYYLFIDSNTADPTAGQGSFVIAVEQ